MKRSKKIFAIIGLLILIAIGGVVMYGERYRSTHIPAPNINGPTTPPPANEANR